MAKHVDEKCVIW